MSSNITGASLTEFGLLSQLLNSSTAIRSNLSTLTEQASSGRIADTYAGLGNGASVSLDLNPQIAALQNRQDNIDAATTRLSITQTTMTQLQQIAATALSDLNNLNPLTPSETDSIAANSRAALTQVANYLDTQNNGSYVFAGQDFTNPPIPNPDAITTSSFFTQIQSAVASLSTNGAAATAASTLATASDNTAGTSPFSAYLSQPASALQAQSVQVGVTQIQQVGLFASANSSVLSLGTSTTGSYMRDLMRALATMGSLTSAQVTDPNFASLVQDTRTSLTNAITAMADDTGVLGDTQAALTTTQTNLADTQTALIKQVSGAQDVDMATTLSNLTQTQTQLQSSYQLIAGMSGLSLSKFLPAG